MRTLLALLIIALMYSSCKEEEKNPYGDFEPFSLINTWLNSDPYTSKRLDSFSIDNPPLRILLQAQELIFDSSSVHAVLPSKIEYLNWEKIEIKDPDESYYVLSFTTTDGELYCVWDIRDHEGERLLELQPQGIYREHGLTLTKKE